MGIFNKEFREIALSWLDESHGVVLLKLNRPDASNAFSEVMIPELCESLEKLDSLHEVRAIVVTGEGKHFCAGGDVKSMLAKDGMFSGEPAHLRKNYRYGIQQIPRTMEFIETPVIAAVNGAAIGAGLDFACMCDIRVASPKAKFGETFVKLGLIPGDGGGFFLQRVIGYSKAMELTLTGEILAAEKALEMGLVNRVSENMLDEALKIAVSISKNAPLAVSYAKKLVRDGYNDLIGDHLDKASTYQGVTQRTEDHFEGVRAILESRSPDFKCR